MKIRVDDENNAEEFWAEIDAAYPTVAQSLRRDGQATVSESDWQSIQSLPGFGGGSSHAPTALIECD